MKHFHVLHACVVLEDAVSNLSLWEFLNDSTACVQSTASFHLQVEMPFARRL